MYEKPRIVQYVRELTLQGVKVYFNIFAKKCEILRKSLQNANENFCIFS